jgi:hypothetical protein
MNSPSAVPIGPRPTSTGAAAPASRGGRRLEVDLDALPTILAAEPGGVIALAAPASAAAGRSPVERPQAGR